MWVLVSLDFPDTFVVSYNFNSFLKVSYITILHIYRTSADIGITLIFTMYGWPFNLLFFFEKSLHEDAMHYFRVTI